MSYVFILMAVLVIVVFVKMSLDQSKKRRK